MYSANPDLMREALRQKKAGALDLTIIIGDPNAGGTSKSLTIGESGDPADTDLSTEEDEDDQKTLGLAPDATPLGETQDENDEDLGEAGNLQTGNEEDLNQAPDPQEARPDIEAMLAKAPLRGSMASRIMKKPFLGKK